MLDVLQRVEEELPNLLDKDGWNSIDVNYHPPRVERIWRQYGEYRINLHRLNLCKLEDALFHPHPWPSVVKVVSGGYWTEIGRGQDGFEPYPVTKLYLGPGSVVVDDDKQSWHSVAPDKVTYSLMITGKPWGLKHWREDELVKPKAELKTLDEDTVKLIKSYFYTV